MSMWLIEIVDLNGMSKADTTEYITDAIRAWANGSTPIIPSTAASWTIPRKAACCTSAN